jgi:hypothetical protein
MASPKCVCKLFLSQSLDERYPDPRGVLESQDFDGQENLISGRAEGQICLLPPERFLRRSRRNVILRVTADAQPFLPLQSWLNLLGFMA